MKNILIIGVLGLSLIVVCGPIWAQEDKPKEGVEPKRPNAPVVTLPDIPLVDSSCLYLRPSEDGRAVEATLQWVLKDENGTKSWICRKDSQNSGQDNHTYQKPNQPALNIRFDAAWSSTRSDEEFIYFERQVRAAVSNSIKDTVITNDAVKQVVQEAVKQELKARWSEFVSDVAKEVIKQQEQEKAAAPAASPSSSVPPSGKPTTVSGHSESDSRK